MTSKFAYPKTIWLAPWCAECDAGSREDWTWCQDKIYELCEHCGKPARKYVLATERPRKSKAA